MPKVYETPFEGILGNSVELRLLEHLMALPRMTFNVTELAKKAEVSRQSTSRVLKKLLTWRLLKVAAQHGNMKFYALDLDSPTVRSLYLFNEALIGEIYPDLSLRSKVERPELKIETNSTTDLAPEVTISGFIGTGEFTGSMGGWNLEVIAPTGESWATTPRTRRREPPAKKQEGMEMMN